MYTPDRASGSPRPWRTSRMVREHTLCKLIVLCRWYQLLSFVLVQLAHPNGSVSTVVATRRKGSRIKALGGGCLESVVGAPRHDILPAFNLSPYPCPLSTSAPIPARWGRALPAKGSVLPIRGAVWASKRIKGW